MMNVISQSKEIEVGATVKLSVDGRHRTFRIVYEVDENSLEDMIAHNTSLGRVLLGRHEKEKVYHTLFDGTEVQIVILQIGSQ